MLLELEGHQVRTASDGRSAISLAATFAPQIALLDIGMPDMDGYAVEWALRQQPRSRDILLVAVTGWGQKQDRMRSREAGFNEHLTKPVDLEALLRLFAATNESTDPPHNGGFR